MAMLRHVLCAVLALLCAAVPAQAAVFILAQPAGIQKVTVSQAWANAPNDAAYIARAGKGFSPAAGGVALPADPSNTLQTMAGLPVTYERATANWSEPDGMLVSAEDAPGGKFRMGIQTYHSTGTNHIDVFVEGSKLTIPGSALTNLVRKDPVTGKTWTDPNFYVFDIAMPSNQVTGGQIQMVADVYPNVGFPVRIGASGSSSLVPANFKPKVLFFDPNNLVVWDTYCLAPASGGATSPSVKGDDTKGGRCPEQGGTPFATLTKVMSLRNSKPTKILAYDGSYLEDTALQNATLAGRPPVWIRFKETRLGATFGRATFLLGDPSQVNNGVIRLQEDILWDGITFNTANMREYYVGSYSFVPYNTTFRRCLVAAMYGPNAQGVNRNGPGQSYSVNGPRVDEQYGIYWGIGYGVFAGGGTAYGDKFSNPDALFTNNAQVAFVESEYRGAAGMGSDFLRNNVVESGSGDLTNIHNNTNIFGNVLTTAASGIPLNNRYTREQVVLVDTVSYDGTNTTVSFQPNAAGNAQTLSWSGVLTGDNRAWVLDPNSKYSYTTYNLSGYGGILGITLYAPGSGGFSQLTMVASGKYDDGLAHGTPIVLGGYAHNDWFQAQQNNQQATAAAMLASAFSDNIIIAANTFLGRPSNLMTNSVGNVQTPPKTYPYNSDGTVNTTVPQVSTALIVDADGRHFHTTDGLGNALPVVQMSAYYGINLPRIPASPFSRAGGAASVLFYNNTNASVTDPTYGTFAPGYGLFAEVMTNPDGTPRSYGGTNGATYSGWVGNLNFAVVNNLMIPWRRDIGDNITWSFAGEQRNYLFVGNTFFGGGTSYSYNTGTSVIQWAAPGATVQDNIMKATWPAMPDFAFQGNSFGSFNIGSGEANNYPASNVAESGMTLPDQSAWTTPLVPPLLTGVAAKSTSTTIRKFDRYGLPIVPGVSLVGAMSATLH